MASSNNNFLSRHAFKAAKELDEARKAGTAPPAVDADGKIINPHIPEYIARAPWYASSEEGPSLKHQRNYNASNRNFDGLDKWLPRAQFASSTVTKFRKGACTNCGALTHSAKTCVDRPRRRGAKLTGSAFRSDEVIGDVNLDFEGKRDRWNGYDIDNFANVQKRYAKLEAARNAIRAENLDSALEKSESKSDRNADGTAGANESDDENNNDDDQDNSRFGDGAVVQETGAAAKTTVRNLRIREDTAKYLYNLDLNSAYYDPKSRSMRADPLPNVDPNDKDFLGDNFVRQSGDVKNLAQMQLFSMRASGVGRNVPHLLAEPSRAEAVFKEYESNKQQLQSKRSRKILEKYGDASDYTKKDPAIRDVDQSEVYVEYNSDGKIISKVKPAAPVSKYAEDVLEKNHTTIWGSYFKNGQWGYACCYQVQRYAFCTGKEGRRAAVETDKEMNERTDEMNKQRNPEPLVKQWERIKQKRDKEAVEQQVSPDEERRKRIRLESDERERIVNWPPEAGSEQAHMPRRTQLGLQDAVTERDMEEYRLQRQMAEDPMAKYLAAKANDK